MKELFKSIMAKINATTNEFVEKNQPKRKKNKIILVRHGQSEGNVNPAVYMDVYDHDIQLTEQGKQEAQEVGRLLSKFISKEMNVYISPYTRTRQTWREIRAHIQDRELSEFLEPRIIEQEHTKFKDNEERKKMFAQQKRKGKFWYRFMHGESGFDVDARVTSFIEALAINKHVHKEEKDTIVIAHDIVIKCFLMRALQLNLKTFENLPNIENCKHVVLESYDMKNFSFNFDETYDNEELKSYLKEHMFKLY